MTFLILQHEKGNIHVTLAAIVVVAVLIIALHHKFQRVNQVAHGAREQQSRMKNTGDIRRMDESLPERPSAVRACAHAQKKLPSHFDLNTRITTTTTACSILGIQMMKYRGNRKVRKSSKRERESRPPNSTHLLLGRGTTAGR